MSSSKVFLTSKNSVWGIINNPVSDNVYRHVLSFDDEALKEKFINDNLIKFDIRTGPGKGVKTKVSYLDILDNYAPSVRMTAVNSFTSTFQIHPKATYERIAQNVRNAGDEVITIESPTYDDLLNKDYAIIKENDKVKFYSLTATRVGQWIQYTAELDIFMTYDVRTMFNIQKTQISRAHLDRFFVNENRLVPIYLKNMPNELLSADRKFLNAEPIEANMEGAAQIRGEPDFLGSKFPLLNAYIEWNLSVLGPSLPSAYIDFTRLYEKVKWSVYFNSKEQDYNQLEYLTSSPSKEKVEGYHLNNSAENLPYIVIVSPSSPQILFEVQLTDGTKTYLLTRSLAGSGMVNAAKSQISSLSFTLLSLSPINEIYDFSKHNANNKLKISDLGGKIWTVTLKEEYLYENWGVIKYGEPYNYLVKKWDSPAYRTFEVTDYNVINQQGYPIITLADFKVKVDNEDYKYEIKAYTHPYNFLKLQGGSNQLIVQPQLIKTINHINRYVGKNDYSILTSGYWIKPTNYKYTSLVRQNIDKENMLIVSNNYALPTRNEAWKDFIVRNKNQRDVQTDQIKFNRTLGGLVSGIGLGVGIRGATDLMHAQAPTNIGPHKTPMMIKGVTQIVGGLAGGALNLVRSQMGAELKLKAMSAQESDLKNTPSQINYNQNSLIGDVSRGEITPYVIKKIVPEHLHVKVREFFYMFGNAMNDRLFNINDYLKTRYFFNYIQADETFENVHLQLSTQIKQMIDVSLKQGITVWHIRAKSNDHTDYVKNQVKNYEVENWEMSLYNEN